MHKMRQYLHALGVDIAQHRAGKFELFLQLIIELSGFEEWPFSDKLINYMQLRKVGMQLQRLAWMVHSFPHFLSRMF